MSDTPKAPKKWSVQNGAFTGYTLVTREDKESGSRVTRQKEDWMPFAVDLRPVNGMKVYGFDECDQGYTSLYNNGTFIGCVNAPYHDLLPEWLKWRSVFDEWTGPIFDRKDASHAHSSSSGTVLDQERDVGGAPQRWSRDDGGARGAQTFTRPDAPR